MSRSPLYRTSSARGRDRRVGGVVVTITLVSLVFVSLPTFIVLVASVSGGRVLKFPPSGITVQPYLQMFENSDIRQALARSLVVGAESILFGALLGVPATMALFRYRLRLRGAFTAYMMLGFSTPLVVSGIAFQVLYIRAGLLGKLWPMALAITIVNLPFLIFAVASSIANLNPELEEAAATLGAEGVQTFLFVTLPGLMPGIMTGSIMMFVFGITEFLVSLILATVANQTLPVVLFGSLRGAVSPMLAAAGGLYIAIAFVVVFLISRVRSLENFLYRGD